MNRITRRWKDARWIIWLRYFIATMAVIIILSMIAEIAWLNNQVSDLRIEQNNHRLKILELRVMLDMVTGVTEVK